MAHQLFRVTLDLSKQMFLRNIIVIVMILLSSTSYAEDRNAIMEKEIQHLLDHLKTSHCAFNRNGKWYTAEEAVNHIHKKYQYLMKKGLVNSTEQFIERAASESSLSGKPYLVKCGEPEPIESSVWFQSELRRFRQ